ncbi:MAG: tRNA lysidine(34) synthetase TilS [Phycisphaerales bacterium]
MTAPRVTERRRRLLEAGRHPFVAAVRRSLAGACGVERNATVIVGVSGGPDSLALLLALAAIAGRSRRSGGIRPLALHVNHHLRPEAAADARFVGRRCEELGIACEVVEIHPAARRGNRHAAARELRYAALAEAAAWRGAAHVATAHHADDQLETMVMALCRGAGPDGLEGIAWRRPLAPGVELIRPLLDRRKAECEAFCRAVGVRWRRDAGNTDQRRARGRLRREILPAARTGVARRRRTGHDDGGDPRGGEVGDGSDGTPAAGELRRRRGGRACG